MENTPKKVKKHKGTERNLYREEMVIYMNNYYKARLLHIKEMKKIIEQKVKDDLQKSKWNAVKKKLEIFTILAREKNLGKF